MRSFFIISLLLLVLASLLLSRWDGPNATRRTELIWTTDDNPLRQQQIALFEKLHPGIRVTLDSANADMEKVIVQSIGGIGPDIFDAFGASQASAYVHAGIALDVTDALASRGIDPARDGWPGMTTTCFVDGHVYGMATNIGANGLWVNQDILRKAGIPLPKTPWTWDQFIPIAQRLTIRDARGHVLQAGLLFDWYNWTHFLYGFGGRIYSPDGRKCTLDSPQAIAAVQLMQDLIYKYRVTPSPVEEQGMAGQGGWGAGNINLFGAGRGAFALGGRWWLANLRTFKGLDLRVIESPTGGVRAFGSVGRATMINKNSPHREEALEFLAFLASKPYNDLVNRQADGVGPIRKFADTPEFLHNPEHPEEVDNAVWKTVSQFAEPNESSPYANGGTVDKIINDQLDLVRIGQKNAAAAMREATREVDAEIAKNLGAPR